MLRLAPDRRTVGLGLALATALISGISIFVNAYALPQFESPSVFTALKNLIVAVALAPLLLRPAARAELRTLNRRQATGLGMLGLIGGSVSFVLFFEGLSRVSSGNAAFIHKTLFVWVAVLAVIFLRERLGIGQLAAVGLLLVSQMLLGGPGALGFGLGEAMVAAATLLWSVEVILAKRLLSTLSSTIGAAGRMVIGAGLLLVYLGATGQISALAQLTAVQWVWVIATGILLFGYVTTWYAALQRAPATAVTCVLTLGAPITALLNTFAGRAAPQPAQLVGYAVLIAAACLIVALGPEGATPGRASPLVRAT